MTNLNTLENQLKLKFKNIKFLKQALTHRSYVNEHSREKIEHNERLEFLGDAVLELIVTEYLYHKFDNPEGELTSWRASLVNTDSLSALAKELGLNEFLFLSRGEAKSTGKARNVILADAFEALIGAIYLDQGAKRAKEFISKNLLIKLPKIIKNKLYKDPKSEFQEISQAKQKITPSYKVLKETGLAHEKKFTVGLFLGDKLISKGQGTSKFEAEVDAAKNGLSKI
ncbi:MAG: ribonuclease III [Patescibacteria group bacterium]|nr:ribonuclease III [Patescibacteria group bacterium]MDD5121154.1 ribonuclease III [Patescibacteria group bacterium]MDD5221669.1 ribonuclease III [Patescibacteria group bacterium]MDD5395927.1 ribonuclease III [Patescibacteria group bacterium]